MDKRSAMRRTEKPSSARFITVRSRAVKGSLPISLAAVGEETTEVGDADRDQQGGQRSEYRQRVWQVARVAHPDVGEDRRPNRGAEHHDRSDDGRPFLVLEVDGNRSPAGEPEQPGSGQPVEHQRADQRADGDADSELLKISHYERRTLDYPDA